MSSYKFVPRVSFPKYNVTLANFHGHHRVGLQKMAALAPQVDLVLEVRDARAPLSTRNGLFERALGGIPKIILYAKNDLSSIDPEKFKTWHPTTQYMQIDCRSQKDAQTILSIAKERVNSMVPSPPLGTALLITGMPNVGKSTFLNTLRNIGLGSGTKAAKTGGMAGVTRSVSSKVRISRDPDIYIFDTPGVFVPQAASPETMIALSIIGALKPTLIDPVIQADYLLYRLNLKYPDGSAYAKYLNHPTNNVEVVLRSIAKSLKRNSKGSNFDSTGAALHWIDRFRQGKDNIPILLDDSSDDAYENFTEQERKRLQRFQLDLNESRTSKRMF